MKKLLILLLLVGFPVFGAVSSSTFTTVSANSVYYVSTEFGPGVPAQYISLYVTYTKGDETSLNVTISWLPDETWAGTTYYAIGERASDETMQPVTLKFDTNGSTMYRIKVPAGTSRMYLGFAYVSGSTGVMVFNSRRERN